IRVGEETLTVPKYGGVLVGPQMMRQVFNDTDAEVLWLIIGAPENEFEPGESFDIKLFWPTDPKQLPKELEGVDWPPKENAEPDAPPNGGPAAPVGNSGCTGGPPSVS